MENELFYLQQALGLRQQANEAIKAIRFILSMKAFEPMNIKDYYQVINLLNDLEIVCDTLKGECNKSFNLIRDRIKK